MKVADAGAIQQVEFRSVMLWVQTDLYIVGGHSFYFIETKKIFVPLFLKNKKRH